MLNKISDFLKVDQFIENILGYFDARIELAKLDAKKQFAGVLAKLIVYSVAIFGILGLFLSITLALGFWLNALLSSGYLGFFLVALLYGIITIIGFSAAKSEKWITSLQSKIEHQIFEADKQKESHGDQNTHTDHDG